MIKIIVGVAIAIAVGVLLFFGVYGVITALAVRKCIKEADPHAEHKGI